MESALVSHDAMREIYALRRTHPNHTYFHFTAEVPLLQAICFWNIQYKFLCIISNKIKVYEKPMPLCS